MAIVKRGGRYGVRVWRGGRQTWIGTFGTLAEARSAEAKERTKPRVRRSETCDAFAARWLEDYPRPKQTTRRTYGYALRPFAHDFAGVRLADLDRPTAREWALRHTREQVQVARALFSDARRDGLVADNPFSELRLPGSRGRRDLNPLVPAQVHELAETALTVHGEYGRTVRAMILFAGFVGLRPGEMFAASWSHLRGDELRIAEQVSLYGELTTPKNGRARTVLVPPPARQSLVELPRLLGRDFIFLTKRGTHFRRSSFASYWSPVRAAYGRPDMDFYDLRHAAATHLLELGLSPSDVGYQLGHTDGGRLVSALYGHPERSARERIRAAFSEPADLGIVRDAQAGGSSGSSGGAA
jgi:integrase